MPMALTPLSMIYGLREHNQDIADEHGDLGPYIVQ